MSGARKPTKEMILESLSKLSIKELEEMLSLAVLSLEKDWGVDTCDPSGDDQDQLHEKLHALVFPGV